MQSVEHRPRSSEKGGCELTVLQLQKGIITGLSEIPRLIIQSVLVDGRVTNIKGKAFEAWLSALSEIKPARVQIYSTDRPVSEAGVERVPPPTLQCIARDIETHTGLQVDAYWAQRVPALPGGDA
jgi:hypothetical protein